MVRRNTTAKRIPVPVVVVVGSAELTARCRALIHTGTCPPAHVKDAELATATTMAARWRPFALVLPQDLYEFDPSEFDALAKDVGAEIISVRSGRAADGEMEKQLVAAIGRYWAKQA